MRNVNFGVLLRRWRTVRRVSQLDLAEVRRDTVEKPPNSFRMSLGSCEVCTTFGKRFQTFRQTEAELVQ